MNILTIAVFVSGGAFLFYGITCLNSQKMTDEFIRFGLNKQKRLLTGYLQILGALGLLFGYFFSNHLVFSAAAGLTLLMLLGFAIRIKIKDSISQSIPSLIVAFLNFYICIGYYHRIF